jgi:hypothetical protein
VSVGRLMTSVNNLPRGSTTAVRPLGNGAQGPAADGTIGRLAGDDGDDGDADLGEGHEEANGPTKRSRTHLS